ncbi:galactose oxidase early set domain-containing protein [Marinobacter sp. ATCH36]|uniref:galactose oxidase early set domain-containing protein n=1 Tax=Marinobacter sp. ATCH36 TaxID=2945106 RepID=UPI0020207A64|nr:galactose oxidase early set domain-containing protein [Marinobacter sp. ATCH36]MCL7945556.1 galactose oxidase early set domain-containing protein [Marinobacter sp. ATCH36]
MHRTKRYKRLPLASAMALIIAGTTPVHAGLLGGLLGGDGESAGDGQPSEVSGDVGFFSEPFAEPTIQVDGEQVATSDRCIVDASGSLQCKPAAGTIAVLGGNRFLYLNALEGTENAELAVIAQFGEVSVNDQSRVMTLDENDQPSWVEPSPSDGGANPDGNESTTLTGGLLDTANNTDVNDGALFCADVVFLPDGKMMAVGGTDYYSEPGIDGLPVGVVELEGLRSSRIFDPATNTWSQSGDMEFGRWYPSLVSLANSDVFVASGVTKLLKPVYPEDPIQSGRNVAQTETYNLETGTWSNNGPAAQRSLPLFPRMHLLPNGHVYYNAGGQAFNPFGQAYDQALWNIVGTYNPESKQWTDLGYAGLPLRLNEIGLQALSTTLNPTNINPDQVERLLGDLVGSTLDDPTAAIGQLLETPVDDQALERAIGSGMRGSTFSIQLPLRPDANGGYHESEFLTAGGVPTYVTAGSPGGYLPISSSRIDTVTTNGDDMAYESRLTGSLNQPRWYGSGVMMPDNSVMVFSGGTRDGVVATGLEGAIIQSERFDIETETWKPMASANRERTYHNTAVLMPDGRVLIGGHSPINTAYLSFINMDELGFADYAGRDPSFEIYTPPYATRDDRPMIEKAPVALMTNGGVFDIKTDRSDIDQVFLIRRKATTHLIDGDQRTVELPIVDSSSNKVRVKMTGNRAVLPEGQYMLFVSYEADDGMRVPSESTPVRVLADPNATDSPLVQQLEPAPAEAESSDGGLIGGLLGSVGSGGSLLDPILDLGSGATSAVPTLGQLQDGTPQLMNELGVALDGGVSVLGDTITSLPGATEGLIVDFTDQSNGG